VVSVTPSPSADDEGRWRPAQRLRRLFPRTFQGRLTLAFLAVVTLSLGLATVLVINRLEDYFTNQQTTELEQRSAIVASFVSSTAERAAAGRPVDDLLTAKKDAFLQEVQTSAQETLERLGSGIRILGIELARVDGHTAGPSASALLDLGDPDLDFVKLADGLGVPSRRVDTGEQLAGALDEAIVESGPHLIEALVRV